MDGVMQKNIRPPNERLICIYSIPFEKSLFSKRMVSLRVTVIYLQLKRVIPVFAER